MVSAHGTLTPHLPGTCSRALSLSHGGDILLLLSTCLGPGPELDTETAPAVRSCGRRGPLGEFYHLSIKTERNGRVHKAAGRQAPSRASVDTAVRESGYSCTF